MVSDKIRESTFYISIALLYNFDEKVTYYQTVIVQNSQSESDDKTNESNTQAAAERQNLDQDVKDDNEIAINEEKEEKKFVSSVD